MPGACKMILGIIPNNLLTFVIMKKIQYIASLGGPKG